MIKHKTISNFIRKYYYKRTQKYLSKDIKATLYYGESGFSQNNEIFVINNNFLFKFSKYGSYVFSILQIQWIFSIFLYLYGYFEYIENYPAKLIVSEYLNHDITEINIHGKVFKQEDNITLEYKEKAIEAVKEKFISEQKQEKLKQERKIQKEKEEAEKKRLLEENTVTLSIWDNNNYTMKVYREYNTVYLTLEVYDHRTLRYRKRIKLGNYDSNITEKEYEGETEGTTVFIHNGYDIKITITNYEYKYNIIVGNGIYDNSFSYNR